MTVSMLEMTWDEYANRIKDSVLFLPVGATEQHGHHLPLGTDYYQVNELSKLIASEVNGIVAPGIPYGYKSQPKSGGGQIFPGTTSLSGTTLINVAKDILSELINDGARKIVVMEGHYENNMFLIEAIDLVLKEFQSENVKIVKCGWPEMLDEDVINRLFPKGYPGLELEHAALIETSFMLLLFPNLVKEDKIVPDTAIGLPNYDIFPQPRDLVPESGVLSDPTGASKEKGRKIMENVIKNYVNMIRNEF